MLYIDTANITHNMSAPLQQLIITYPHIRCSILQPLLPSEVSALCIAIGYVLEQFDKKQFLNPINEVFVSGMNTRDNTQTLLVGDNIRQLTSYCRPGMKLYAYMCPGTQITNYQGINVVSHHTSSSIPLEGHVDVVLQYDPLNFIGIGDIEMAFTNSRISDALQRWNLSTVNTLDSEYECECVISTRTDWWFSKVVLQFIEFDYSPAYDGTVTRMLNMNTVVYAWYSNKSDGESDGESDGCDYEAGMIGIMSKKLSK